MLIKNPYKIAKTKTTFLKPLRDKRNGINFVFASQRIKDHFSTLRMIERNQTYFSQFEVCHL